jgi:hypothetical protein
LAGKSTHQKEEATPLSSSPLKKRNIANIQELDRFIEEIVSEGFHGQSFVQGEKWLKTRFRKYMIKEYHDLVPLTDSVDDHVPGSVPINQAIRSGSEVYKLRLDARDARELRSWILHGLDYLQYAQENHGNLPKGLRFRDAQSLSVDDVLNRADKWTTWLNKKAKYEEALSGTRVVKELADGHKWVEVITREALDREGKLMHHCVGSYAPRVEQGQCKIFSLRDADHVPHVTLELRGRRVFQIQGKCNLTPDFEYQDYTVDFINAMGFELDKLTNLRHWGFISYQKKIYRISDLPKEFWTTSQSEALDLLSQAVEDGDDELIRQIMESGISASDGWPVEPLSQILYTAFQHPSLEIELIEWLLRLGATVRNGYLKKAIEDRDMELLDLLLEHGADPNTALDYAVMRSDVKMVRILLSYGAVPIKKNRLGECAIDLAEKVNDPIVKYLLNWSMRHEIYKRVRRVKRRGKWQGAQTAIDIMSGAYNQIVNPPAGKQMSLFSAPETGGPSDDVLCNI